MDVDGPGVIRHIWMTTPPKNFRHYILRFYWDGQEQPSIEAPLGDFFCQGWNATQDIFAGPINVNPNMSMNCFFPMPFRKHARITIENRSPADDNLFFYTINYTLEEVEDDALYLHAQFRRANPLAYAEVFTLLDGVRGQGHWVGAFMCWQPNVSGWWGEGELKMYIDGDDKFPTICGTGTEDYFGGAWDFGGRNYSAACFGYRDIHGRTYESEMLASHRSPGNRMTMYRFHVHDPVYFRQDLRVTIQALGWRSENRYLPLQPDISSVAYWYQTLPTATFPQLPSPEAMEIV